jgi:hypothetical protein
LLLDFEFVDDRPPATQRIGVDGFEFGARRFAKKSREHRNVFAG